MIVWGALAGGAIGTVILTSGLRLAQELGITRMDMPLMLGTAFTEDRTRASVIGYVAQLATGIVFALVYAGVFAATGHAGWVFGVGLGFVHTLFSGGVLVALLPAAHPRMGTAWSDAEETPLLEPPGFMLFNYGRRTALVTLLLHLAYGAIVGGFAGGLDHAW
jgi:hypothetical protein